MQTTNSATKTTSTGHNVTFSKTANSRIRTVIEIDGRVYIMSRGSKAQGELAEEYRAWGFTVTTRGPVELIVH